MEVEGVAAIVAESRYLWRMDSEETRRLLLVGDVMGNNGEGGMVCDCFEDDSGGGE